MSIGMVHIFLIKINKEPARGDMFDGMLYGKF